MLTTLNTNNIFSKLLIWVFELCICGLSHFTFAVSSVQPSEGKLRHERRQLWNARWIHCSLLVGARADALRHGQFASFDFLSAWIELLERSEREIGFLPLWFWFRGVDRKSHEAGARVNEAFTHCKVRCARHQSEQKPVARLHAQWHQEFRLPLIAPTRVNHFLFSGKWKFPKNSMHWELIHFLINLGRSRCFKTAYIQNMVLARIVLNISKILL